jgi:putative peptidoglycan lipid II flippase
MRNKIFKGALIIAFLSLLSGILSAFKKGIILWAFDAKQGDIFTASFVIPDFLFTLIIFGAMSTVFIPNFVQSYEKSKDEAFKYASALIIFITTLVFLGAILAFLFAPLIVNFIVPGFSTDAKAQTVHLTRIMLLQPIFLGLASILGSILQSFNQFFVYAFTPVLYQLSVILGLTYFYRWFGIDGFAFGVVLGSIMQFLFQIPSVLKTGFYLKFDFSRQILLKVKQTLLLTIPRTFGMLADKINLVLMTALSSTISQGSVRIFSSAFDIATVVTGLIGISFATAAFPTLSKSANNHQSDKQNFLQYFSQVFLQILFWSLAACILFLMLRIYIVRVIAGYGKCDWECTQITAATVGVFSLSLFAQSLIPLLSRAFFAFKNTAIPVLIGVIGNIINVTLAFYFLNLAKTNDIFYSNLKLALKLQNIESISPMVVVLALAFSIASLLQFIMLWLALDVKLNGIFVADISRSWMKMMVSATTMVPVIYFALRVFDEPLNKILFPGKTVVPIFLQGLLAGLCGIIIYILVSKILKIKQVDDVIEILTKKIF